MKDYYIVAIVAAVPAIMSWFASRANTEKVDRIHKDMNSRFDEWMAAAKAASFAEGVKSTQPKRDDPA